MKQDLSYTILKYLVLIIIIYTLFKLFLDVHIDDTDLLYIIVVSVIIYAIIKNLYDSYVLLPFNSSAFFNEHLTDIVLQPTSIKQPIIEPVVEPVKPVVEPVKPVVEPVKPVVEPVKPVVEQITQPMQQEIKQEQKKDDYMTRNSDGSYTIKPKINIQTEPTEQPTDVIANEMIYNYIDLNQIPYDDTKSEFEYGYSFIPPTNWFPVPTHPPVCVTTRRHNVCAIPTTGTDLSLKEWNTSRRISQPDNINVKYIKEKLNAGN